MSHTKHHYRECIDRRKVHGMRALSKTVWLAAALSSACGSAIPPVSSPTEEPEADMHRIDVLDSYIAYVDQGSGPAVVFLHGNPTSSHVWRRVIPHVARHARCLAPDLIGMGRSGKPDIPYRFADHARYLDAWFDALDLRDVVLVGYDWGGALAMDWAARHPERVRGLVVFETFLREMRWEEWPPAGAELFRALRTPEVGERLVLEENEFLARSLAHGVQSGLSEADRAVYYAPYPDAPSRRPMLQWPREIPIEGEPADVVEIVRRYGEWLASSRDVPKLFLTFRAPSVLGSPAIVEWARANVAALEIVELGPAGHHAPEDRPDEIGAAIARWLGERVAAAEPASTAPILVLDPRRDPDLWLRIDAFSVPDGARTELERTIGEVLSVLRGVDGFRGHAVFVQREGPSRYGVISMVAWADRAAFERGGERVREHFRQRGIDVPRLLERWGAELVRGDYGLAPFP